MSKIHTTRKYINAVWKHVYYCGYCDLQYIFRYEYAVYYNSGIYGWNFDVYCDYSRNIAITTGYRNMTGKKIPHELVEKYSKVAEEIYKNTWAKPYEEIKKALDENREKFLDELLKL